MQAYLEADKVIKICIDKWFYEGKTDHFSLYQGANRTDLKIERVEEQDTMFCYFSEPMPSIDVTHAYTIYEAHAKKCKLRMGSYVRTDEFDEQFFYDGSDLGPSYSSDGTQFKLWAPIAQSVVLRCFSNEKAYVMQRQEKGVWSCTITGDCDRFEYVYIINNIEQISEVIDPYALTSTANSERSIVVDPTKFSFTINKAALPSIDGLNDLITYELSVRDYTYQQRKSTFQALIDKFDYLENLGITNLQLLPVYDFETVHEADKYAFYNWGYDPHNYNVLDGSLVDNPNAPYERADTFGQLIAHANSKGIRVSMDVVYNHLYDASSSIYNRIVPGYFTRFHKDGSYSNGSFCGNDFRSEGAMVRKFIVDSVCMFVKLYGVDGFRFDLMGDLDIKTMNAVKAAVGPDILIYGEGWNMPSSLAETDRACIENEKKLPSISHFNDRFRNAFRGTSSKEHEQGLLAGSTTKAKHLKELLSGSPHIFSDLFKSLNYIECHDNHTFYDWLKEELQVEDEAEVKAICTAGLATVLLSFGAPFLHAGQEFMRTKQGVENSYNVSDEINQFDWTMIEKNTDVVAFTKELIAYRQSKPEYRFSYEHLKQKVSLVEFADNQIEMKSDNLHILFNFSGSDTTQQSVDNTFRSNLPIDTGILKKHQICYK